jgi:hypothetical protein
MLPGIGVGAFAFRLPPDTSFDGSANSALPWTDHEVLELPGVVPLLSASVYWYQV